MNCQCYVCNMNTTDNHVATSKYSRYKAAYDRRNKNWRDTHKDRANAISRKSQKKARINCKLLKDKIATVNPCYQCKETRIGCLDFHHIDSTTKEKPVARCQSESDLLTEASKCIVLCANCHRLFHNGDIQLSPDFKPIDVSPFVS